LCDADPEELSRIVPLVERLRRVDALVALEPDQPRVEHLGEGLRRLGLADARLSLEKQWLRQAEREEQRGRAPTVGHGVALAQTAREATWRGRPACAATSGPAAGAARPAPAWAARTPRRPPRRPQHGSPPRCRHRADPARRPPHPRPRPPAGRAASRPLCPRA